MFFIIVDYIQKKINDIKKKEKLLPIKPIYDSDDSYCDYDSDGEPFPLNYQFQFPLNKKERHITIVCRYSTQEELDALV